MLSWMKEDLEGKRYTEENHSLTSDILIKELSVFYDRSVFRIKSNQGLRCAASQMHDIADGVKTTLGLVLRFYTDKPITLVPTLLGSSLYMFDRKLKGDEKGVVQFSENEVLEVYMSSHYIADYKVVKKE